MPQNNWWDQFETVTSPDNFWDQFETVNLEPEVPYSGGFWKGIMDLPTSIGRQFGETRSKIRKSIGEGNYQQAFNELIDPLWGLAKGPLGMAINAAEGQPLVTSNPEEIKQQAGSSLLDVAGFPVEETREAIAHKDVPRFAGQATTALAGLALGRLKFRKPAITEIGTRPWTGDAIQQPLDFGTPEPRQMDLPFPPPSGPAPTAPPLTFDRSQPTLPGMGFNRGRVELAEPLGAEPQYPKPYYPAEGVQEFLPLGPEQRGLDFGEAPGQLFDVSPRPKPTESVVAQAAELPPIVYLPSPTPAEVALWKGRGYTPGGVVKEGSHKGEVFMLRGDTPVKPVTPPPDVTGTSLAVPKPGEDFPVPVSKVDKTYIQNMLNGGWRVIGRSADGANLIFREITRIAKEESGEFDLEALKAGWARLRARLGREPNVDEVQEEVNRIRGTVAPQEGERRGLVADFTRPGDEVPPEILEQLRTQAQEPEFLFDPLKADDFPELDPRMRGRLEQAGARPSDFAERVLQEGQQNLPFMDVIRNSRLGQIAEQQRLPFEQKPEPLDVMDYQGATQKSLVPQFQDAEIADYLRREDATPPESRDLGFWENLWKGESGELDPEVLKRNTQEEARRLRDSVDRIYEDRLRNQLAGEFPITEGEWIPEPETVLPPRQELPVQKGQIEQLINGEWVPASMEEPIQPNLREFRNVAGTDFTYEHEMYPLQGGGARPYDTRPPSWVRPTVQEAMAKRGRRITELIEQGRSLEREAEAARLAGNEIQYEALRDEARARKQEATTLRQRMDWESNRRITKAEEMLAKADYREEKGDKYGAETARNQADKLFAEEAGQLKLALLNDKHGKLRQELGLSDVEITEIKEAISQVNPQHLSEGIDHGYARSTLMDIPYGNPGLEIVEHWGNKDTAGNWTDGSWQINYRDSQGKPVGSADVNMTNGRGKTYSLAADKDSGVYGRAVFAIGKEIIKRKAYRPSGSYSPHTANILSKLLEIIEGGDQGAVPVEDVLNAYKHIFQAIGEGATKLKVAFGIPEGTLAKLFKDEQGAVQLSDIGEAARKVKGVTGWGQGRTKKKVQGPDEYNFIKEALLFPSASTTTGDLSPMGRQGMPLVLTPQFWHAAGKAFGGLSERGFDQIDAVNKQSRIWQRPFDPVTGQFGKSVGEKMGMKLFTPASKPGQRAEAVASKWLETGEFPLLKDIPGFQPVYSGSVGKWYIRPTNRFYITFLNTLQTNRAQFLMDRMEDMSLQALTTGQAPMQGLLGGAQFGGVQIGLKRKYGIDEAMNINPYYNMERAKEIGDLVRTSIGQAPMKTHLLPFDQGEINLEAVANKAAYVLFSPGMLASRVRLLNPNTYIMATPRVRREYLKAALGATLGWAAFTTLASNAASAMGVDHEIVMDPTNSDFGKFRIGDLRLDFGAGFLQFAVLLSRMYQGGWTSSSNPEEGLHRFGEGFQAETQWSNLLRFGTNKLNPVTKFAVDVLDASEGKPFHVMDRTAQLFVQLFVQDLVELHSKHPELLPWMTPVLFGAGTQTYGRTRDYLGQGESKFISPENDWVITGGGLRERMPWNWSNEEPVKY